MYESNENVFTKDNLDSYLKELGKEYRKLSGKMSTEIVLIGGAAIIARYGFRDITTDIDAIIQASTIMEEAIKRVSNSLDLPYDWMNTDFMKTASYSDKLRVISKPYKQFSNVLNVRIVSGEYLVAMKLCSGRQYKNDLSDIVGILLEHEKNQNSISLDKIKDAYKYLYGTWDQLSEESKSFIEGIYSKGDLQKIYIDVREKEMDTRNALIQFNKDYPGVTNTSNVNDILESLNEKITKVHTANIPISCISPEERKNI